MDLINDKSLPEIIEKQNKEINYLAKESIKVHEEDNVQDYEPIKDFLNKLNITEDLDLYDKPIRRN